MSISLKNKLMSIPNNQIVAELNRMLEENSRVRISWWGKRLVSIDGYPGEVKIDTLREKFFSATPSSFVDHFILGIRIAELYEESDRKLNNTCFYRFLVPDHHFKPISVTLKVSPSMGNNFHLKN